MKSFLAWSLVLTAALMAAAAARADPLVEAGRRIYEQGALPDGRPLQGTRWDSLVVSGPNAACSQCHRPSGMGSVEGDIQAPPISGNALFDTGPKVVATMDPRSGKAFNQAHPPYTLETLGVALRSGVNLDGSRMNVMMPRFELGDGDMAALVAYLRELSSRWSPGVTDTTIRFATVITPDVPPERRAVFIEQMRKMVAQKNGSTAVAGGNRTRHHMAGAAEMVLGTERTWILDTWELQGAPETWARQLDELYERQPVFALMSGLSGGNWEPVGEFSERTGVPCWFPVVDLPPEAAPRYTIYFNGGVRLEAGILANRLRSAGATAPKRVLQVFRDDYVGRGAARATADALAGSGIDVNERVLRGDAATALPEALAGIGSGDAVMLWLRKADLAQLPALAPSPWVFASGQLGGADAGGLPDRWKAVTRLIYPYELPQKRLANLAYYRTWLHQRRIREVDEVMQSEAYFAVAYLTDSVTEMLDNLYRDYLLERAEEMISRREGGKAEYEYYSSTMSKVRTEATPGTLHLGPRPTSVPQLSGLGALQQAGTAFHQREGTTVFPRLQLGPGQRFASKGGYVVHFGADATLVADSEWIVP